MENICSYKTTWHWTELFVITSFTRFECFPLIHSLSPSHSLEPLTDGKSFEKLGINKYSWVAALFYSTTTKIGQRAKIHSKLVNTTNRIENVPKQLRQYSWSAWIILTTNSWPPMQIILRQINCHNFALSGRCKSELLFNCEDYDDGWVIQKEFTTLYYFRLAVQVIWMFSPSVQ